MPEMNENVLDSLHKSFTGKISDKDAEEFGERLRTYIDGQKWVRRPLDLSPAVCAQYGWKCINSNLLECVTCVAKLCAPEPQIDLSDVYKSCMGKISSDLKASHKTHCPWPITPSPDSFVRMHLMPKEESLNHFDSRMSFTMVHTKCLPAVKESAYSLLGLEESQVTALCRLAEISDNIEPLYGRSATVLAATGWCLKLKPGINKVFLSCENCQRTIAYEAFNTVSKVDSNQSCDQTSTSSTAESTVKDSGDDDDRILAESPRKRLKKEDFDPFEEHRPWCLWITSSPQNYNISPEGDNPETDKGDPSSKQPGWKVFLKSLLRNVSEPPTSNAIENPSKEQIRHVRNMLDTWTDATKS